MDETGLLTDDERDHYRKWEQMFQSEGWGLLQKEMGAEVEAIPLQSFTNANSYEEMVALRVRARVIAELLSYEEIVRLRKEHLMMSRQQDREATLESESVKNL